MNLIPQEILNMFQETLDMQREMRDTLVRVEDLMKQIVENTRRTYSRSPG